MIRCGRSSSSTVLPEPSVNDHGPEAASSPLELDEPHPALT